MSEIVIDLETRDTKISAKVVSIGAVKMDFHRPFNTCIGSNFYVELDWEAQFKRTRSDSTDKFWEDVGEEAREALNGKWSLRESLIDLSNYIGYDDVVWGNGSTFDISILQHCYEQFKMDTPWKYYNVGDYRTIKRKYLEKNPHLPYMDFEGVKHNALDDAKHEARLLHKMWNSL